MKKIISLLASVAMIVSASATVFAATPSDANPKATISLVGDENTTRVIDDETYYMYTATIDMTGIGTIDCTAAEADESYNVGTRLVQYEVGFVGDLQAGSGAGVTSTLGTVKQVKAKVSQNYFDGIYVQFAATSVDTAYPTTPDTVTDGVGNGIIVSKFYGKPGATFTMESSLCKLGYQTYVFDEDNWAVKDSGDGVTYAPITYDKEVYTLPTFDKELALTVTPEAKQTNGYVWTADITKGANDITSFTAKFTADGETADRAISNIDAVNKFLGEGSTQFNIGLKTAKALTAVEFAVSDGATTATANPAVSQ